MATSSEKRKLKEALLAGDMKELTQKFPALITSLLGAGYKPRLCQDNWVYTKTGRVLHEHTAFQKQVNAPSPSGLQYYDIRCVVIDPCEIFSETDVAISFVVSYGMGTENFCMLEKVYHQPQFDLERIEKLFHRVFEATQF